MEDGLNFEGDRDLAEPIKRVVNMLASAQVALYPVGAEGVGPDSLYEASRISARSGGSVTSQSPNINCG